MWTQDQAQCLDITINTDNKDVMAGQQVRKGEYESVTVRIYRVIYNHIVSK